MIRYLHNAANDIEYTDKDGRVVTLNPFSPHFLEVSQRLSATYSNDADNQQRRKNYEDAVRDVNLNIDQGRPATLTVPFPLHINTPEDFTQPIDEDNKWDPPLLTVKRTAPLPNQSVGIGPDSPARHPVEEKIAGMSLSAKDALGNALAVLGTVGPALPSFIELLQSLLSAHHKAQ